MKAETEKFLDKAARAIRAAEALLRDGDADFAAGRAYYAMFYTAEALLGEKGLRSRKHAGVHALFGEHFSKTGQLDPRFHRWLLDAFDKRLQGDYSVEAAVASEEAAAVIEQARQFFVEACKYLGAGP